MLRIFSQVILDRCKRGHTNDVVIEAVQKSDNPEMMAYVFSGSIIGAFYWWQKNNYDVPIDEFIKFAKQSVLSMSNSTL